MSQPIWLDEHGRRVPTSPYHGHQRPLLHTDQEHLIVVPLPRNLSGHRAVRCVDRETRNLRWEFLHGLHVPDARPIVDVEIHFYGDAEWVGLRTLVEEEVNGVAR